MGHIDSHQHFWHPARGDYGWMPDNDPVLSRPYSPADLLADLDSTGVDKTVLVQAAPSLAETEYLLGIADCTAQVAKVVGWIDFEDATQIDTLTRLAAHPKFVGVRPMIQDLADDNWMLRPDIQWAFEALVDLNLTFDCLGFPRHLDNFHKLLSQYPKLHAVIDHCMKPQLCNHDMASFNHWAKGMTRLAEDTNAYCKISGLVTEADTDWSDAVLRPYTDHVLSVFGVQRCMWGSDWPVARLRCEYKDWFKQSHRLSSHLSPDENKRLYSGTAANFYRID